jgi:cell division septation protein DedD
MPRNELSDTDGQEFELVLGNKQMLSVFFIVVILLGIFFTMGYVVGRNSAPVVEARQTETYDRQNAPSAVPASVPSREVVAPKAEVASPKPAEIPQVTVIQPQVGQIYMQVLAVAKSEAEVLAEVLAKKGFRALVAPGPNDKVFRVLVGPAKDVADASKLKTDLEAAGFKPFLKKY